MNEITILIIGIAIGYFWAMYRVENIKIKIETFNNTVQIDAEKFWRHLEGWKKKKDAEAVPK